MSNDLPPVRKAVCFIRIHKDMHENPDNISSTHIQQNIRDLLSLHGWVVEFLSVPYLAETRLVEEISEVDLLNTTISIRRLGQAARLALTGLINMGVPFTEMDKRNVYQLGEVSEDSIQNLLIKKVEEIAALEQKLALARKFIDDWSESFRRQVANFQHKIRDLEGPNG